jgi:hypothetical protein
MHMPGTGAGGDSIFYRIYIVGGLIGIVVAVVGTAALFDPHGTTGGTLYVGFTCVTLFFAGILAYWWWQLLFRSYGDPKRMVEEASDGTPEIKALKSWSTLSEAMAIHGGNVDEQIELEKAARRPMIEFFGWMTVSAIYVFVSMWLYLLNILPSAVIPCVAMGVIFLAIVMLVRTYFLLGGGARASEHAYLAPLGLALVETPTADLIDMVPHLGQSDAADVTVLAGIRHKRPVQIVIAGKLTYTMVRSPAPRFAIESQKGRLVAVEGAPTSISRALRGLRKAKRWVGMSVQAGPKGILVQRTPGRRLWLAEWLLEQLGEE